MVKGVGVEKQGYEKIAYGIKQALRDGLRYIWVGTCCIRNVAHMTMPYESGGSCRQKRWAWFFLNHSSSTLKLRT
jgi:hypothetical protein